MDRAEALWLWKEILTRGENVSPTEAVRLELSEYSGKTADEVRRVLESAHEISKERWEEADRSTPTAIKDFYKDAWSIVFSGLNYHARQAEGLNVPLPVEIIAAIDPPESAEMLDFGAGVGTASALFARGGWKVSLADVSMPLLEFARWRLRRLNIEASFIDLNKEKLGENKYDLITAFNTMAHVPPAALESTVTELRNALRPNGLLVFDIDARRPSPGKGFHFNTHPHFYAHRYEVLRRMRRLGFLKKSSISAMLVFQRSEHPALHSAWYGLVDFFRYSAAIAGAGNVLRKLRPRNFAWVMRR